MSGAIKTEREREGEKGGCGKKRREARPLDKGESGRLLCELIGSHLATLAMACMR